MPYGVSSRVFCGQCSHRRPEQNNGNDIIWPLLRMSAPRAKSAASHVSVTLRTMKTIVSTNYVAIRFQTIVEKTMRLHGKNGRGSHFASIQRRGEEKRLSEVTSKVGYFQQLHSESGVFQEATASYHICIENIQPKDTVEFLRWFDS